MASSYVSPSSTFVATPPPPSSGRRPSRDQSRHGGDMSASANSARRLSMEAKLRHRNSINKLNSMLKLDLSEDFIDPRLLPDYGVPDENSPATPSSSAQSSSSPAKRRVSFHSEGMILPAPTTTTTTSSLAPNPSLKAAIPSPKAAPSPVSKSAVASPPATAASSAPPPSSSPILRRKNGLSDASVVSAAATSVAMANASYALENAQLPSPSRSGTGAFPPPSMSSSSTTSSPSPSISSSVSLATLGKEPDIASLLSLTPRELAVAVHKALLTAAALRRNVEHLTSIGEHDYQEMKRLEQKFDALKKRYDGQQERILKTEKENRDLKAAANSDHLAASISAATEPPPPRSSADSSSSSNQDVNVPSLQASLLDALSRVSLLSSSNKRLGEQRLAESETASRQARDLKAANEALANEVKRSSELKSKADADAATARRLEAEVATLSSRLDYSEQNVAALSLRLTTESSVDSSELLRHRQAAAALRKELDTSVPNLKQQLQKRDGEIADLLAANARAGVQLESARLSAGFASVEKERLLSSLAAASLELKDSVDSRERAEASERRAMEAFETEAKSRRAEIIGAGMLRDELEARRAEAGRLDALSLELDVRGMEIVRLKVELEEVEESRQQLREELERERSKKSQAVQSQDLTVQALQRAREGSDEAATIILKEKREVEQQLAAAIASRLADAASFDLERASMLEKLQHTEEILVTMKAREEENDVVMATMRAQAQEALSSRAELTSHLQQSVQELTDEKSLLLASVDDLSSRLSSATASSAALRSELLSLQSDAFSHAAELSKASMIAGGLRKEVEAMQEQRRRVEVELREKVVECRRLGESVERLEAEIRDERVGATRALKAAERDRDKAAGRVRAFERRFESIVARLREIEGDTRATIESMGGDKDRENNIISWAFEKIDIDIKLLVLGDDEEGGGGGS